MDFDTFAPGYKSENVVTEHWVAAARHLVLKAFHILGVKHQDIVSGTRENGPFDGGGSIFHYNFRLLALSEDILLDFIDVDCALRDGGIHGNQAVAAVLLAELVLRLHTPLQFPVLQAPLGEFAPVRRQFA